jgi:nitrous oxidase accessory protein NosD
MDSVRKRSATRLLLAAVAAASTGIGLIVSAGAALADGGSGHAADLRVSAAVGVDTPTCGAANAPCASIGQAISNAHAGDTVRVEPGVYHEQVIVPMPLTLRGYGATIDATGLSKGSDPMQMDAAALLIAPTASGSQVTGFRVTGAYGEGIFVVGADHVRIMHNRVYGNDQGTPENTPYFECQPQGEVPGDCGEGVHLMSATDSIIANNRIIGNSGGVLVTDEIGPAHDNRIVGNYVAGNLFDCGITLPSHSASALDAAGNRQPKVAGVYDNLVAGNRVFGNGVLGEGAGVLFAAAQPGSASYDNTVVANVISGNNLAGVTIHAHAPNQDVSGNVIEHNTIGPNNLGGDPDAGVSDTTGVLVFAPLGIPGVLPVSVTIRGNHIHGDVNPVWTSNGVTVLS